MPNGTHMFSDDEWAKAIRFFDHNEQELSAFAQLYGLQIDKYYHGASSWDFRFQHPKGGQASIELFYEPKDDATAVSSNWFIDDYDQGTRFLRWSDGGRRPIRRGCSIRSELARELTKVLDWNRTEMSAHSDYQQSWHRHTKAEFEQMALRGTSLPRNLDILANELQSELP